MKRRSGARHCRRIAAGPACAAVLLVLGGIAFAPAPAAARDAAPADTLRVSLEACVTRALAQGEEMGLADLDRSVASARYLQARSTALPQVALTATYTRQVESIFGQQGSEEPLFEADTTGSIEERVRALAAWWQENKAAEHARLGQ